MPDAAPRFSSAPHSTARGLPRATGWLSLLHPSPLTLRPIHPFAGKVQSQHAKFVARRPLCFPNLVIAAPPPSPRRRHPHLSIALPSHSLPAVPLASPSRLSPRSPRPFRSHLRPLHSPVRAASPRAPASQPAARPAPAASALHDSACLARNRARAAKQRCRAIQVELGSLGRVLDHVSVAHREQVRVRMGELRTELERAEVDGKEALHALSGRTVGGETPDRAWPAFMAGCGPDQCVPFSIPATATISTIVKAPGPLPPRPRPYTVPTAATPIHLRPPARARPSVTSSTPRAMAYTVVHQLYATGTTYENLTEHLRIEATRLGCDAVIGVACSKLAKGELGAQGQGVRWQAAAV